MRSKSVVWGIVQSYGFPIGAVAAVVLFLVYRDIRAKITTGDPLLVEKVAARVHERFGPVRERIIERVHFNVRSLEVVKGKCAHPVNLYTWNYAERMKDVITGVESH